MPHPAPAPDGPESDVRVEFTSSSRTPIPTGLKAVATFLHPHVARPLLAEMARRGPEERDLPLLSRFAPAHPDPEVHRMILAALARALPRAQVPRAFLALYEMPGPSRKSRRQLVREVMAAYDPGLLAPIWGASERTEKLDIVARLRRMGVDKLERFMSQLTISDDRDPVISCLSLDVWERLDDDAAARILIERLRRRNPRLRAQSLEALAVILEPDETRRLLGRCTRDPDPEPRAVALAALARLDDGPARAGLASMLSSTCIEEVVAARQAMRRLVRPADDTGEVILPASVCTRQATGRIRAIRPDAARTDQIPAIKARPATAER